MKDLLDYTILPRERFVRFGPGTLSDSELLCIILRSGSKSKSVYDLANCLLAHFGGIVGLKNCLLKDLTSLKGIGLVKALSLLASIELGMRIVSADTSRTTSVRGPSDIYAIVRPFIFAKKQEHLFLLCLGTRNTYLELVLISVGTLDASLISIREVLSAALRRDSVAVALVHNHPSGNLLPSTADIDVTTKFAAACELLGLCFVDHVIVSDTEFLSMQSLNS